MGQNISTFLKRYCTTIVFHFIKNEKTSSELRLAQKLEKDTNVYASCTLGL